MLVSLCKLSFEAAAQAVADRAEEINRLNVFPVPDGDTGTNMSLTLRSVVEELKNLDENAGMKELCAAITHGSLMGARGNSGVITSQILRGFSEAFQDLEKLSTKDLNLAFKRSVKVAFQAVRKPVEGTILTVLRDTAQKVEQCDKAKVSLEACLEALVAEAFDSVARTPEHLPVLKENGVVDAGGFGLAIFFEAFVLAATGRTSQLSQKSIETQAVKVEIEGNDDWEGSEYRYCTEFLFHADVLNVDEAQNFLASMGDCELLVGMPPNFKVHVHTDTPDKVLAYMLERGQISEVHIHNMDLQAHERTRGLAEQKESKLAVQEELKDLGFVAVASGEGSAEILESLGVDVVVRGGQTMNPSTKDLLDAIERVPAREVIVFPNNKNIIMAAQSAVQAASKPALVVNTKTVPQSFSAIFACDLTASLEENGELMHEALAQVHDIELTYAIKDSHTETGEQIVAGNAIALVDGKLLFAGDTLEDLVLKSIDKVLASAEVYSCTMLAGKDLADGEFEALVEKLEGRYETLEFDSQRGEQPLYPLIMSLE